MKTLSNAVLSEPRYESVNTSPVLIASVIVGLVISIQGDVLSYIWIVPDKVFVILPASSDTIT